MGIIDNMDTSHNEFIRLDVRVNRGYKDNDGNYLADWIPCKAFGKTAEFICKYFDKGDPIMLECQTQQNNYTDKKGNNIYSFQFVVQSVNFVPSKKSDNDKKDNNGKGKKWGK